MKLACFHEIYEKGKVFALEATYVEKVSSSPKKIEGNKKNF